MKDRQNVDDARTDQIDDSVRPNDHLADIRSLQLGHDAARFGKPTQAVCRLEEAFGVEGG